MLKVEDRLYNKGRLDELDFVKCILIMLMISFHLVYFESLHPYAKQVVYTFHMPGFLLISGYLMGVRKTVRQFAKSMKRLAFPYLVWESGYIVMASILPIQEHIDHLTPALFIDKLLLHPLGPYWYLRSLLLCGIPYYAVWRMDRTSTATRWLLLGLVLGGLNYLGWLNSMHATYFIIGAVARQNGLELQKLFPSTWLAAIGLAWLTSQPENLHPMTPGGMLIVVLAMGLILWCYPLHILEGLRQYMLYIGRHTLPIFIYSPIFTLICKGLIPYLRFDPSGLLFLTISLTMCIAGGLAIDWTVERSKRLIGL